MRTTSVVCTMAAMSVLLATSHLVSAQQARDGSTSSRKIALVVAIAEYTHWTALPYAARDAAAIVEGLIRGGFQPENVHVLSDVEKASIKNAMKQPPPSFMFEEMVEPSKDQIQAKLSELAGQTARGDSLLVYLSGHGGTNGDARMFAAKESNAQRVDSMLSVTSIMRDMTKADPSAQLVLVVDACADGSIFDAPGGTTSRYEAISQFYSSLLAKRSYWDEEFQQSVFTHYFVEAMRDADRTADDEVDAYEIALYLSASMPRHRIVRAGKAEPSAGVHDHQPALVVGKTVNGDPYAATPASSEPPTAEDYQTPKAIPASPVVIACRNGICRNEGKSDK